MDRDLEVAVLGPVEGRRGGQALALGGRKQRAVLAVLALDAGRAVSTTQLIDAVWGEEAHERAQSTLQVYVSNLRKVLEPDRAKGAPATVLVNRGNGYCLDLEQCATDLAAFEALAIRAGEARRDERHEDVVANAEAGLGLWTGEVLADMRGDAWADAAATRLEELRLGLIEDRNDAALALGRHAGLVPELEGLVREHPFRERLRQQLVLALYRSGRQAEALRAYGDARSFLVDELGIEPGAELRELEAAILRQDPTLDLPRVNSIDVLAAHTTIVATGAGERRSVLVLPDGQRIALGSGPCTIGRLSECTVRLQDSRVSRTHAELSPVGEGWTASDLGSTNGTEVNGVPASATPLSSGDVISVGGVELRYEEFESI